LHADACFHAPLVIAFDLFLHLIQIVLYDHGLQNGASVFKVGVEAELVTENDNSFSFLNQATT
jgi:hypothetical protein